MTNYTTLRFLVRVLLVAMPFWFGSCGKDGDVTPSSSAIEGTWRISGYKIDPGVDLTGTGAKTTDFLVYFGTLPGGADIVACLTDTKLTFNPGGKVTGTAGSKCDASTDMNPVEDNATWKVDGNKLTLTSSAGAEVYDTSLNGRVLKMSQNQQQDFDGDGKTEAYTFTLELTKI